MTQRTSDLGSRRQAISVAEMARLCGVSRTHFWALIAKGTMPPPTYDIRTRRPMFLWEHQQLALAVRETGIGWDDRYVVFYVRRAPAPMVSNLKPKKVERNGEILEGLRALGMASATDDQVTAAVAELYPKGTAGIDPGVVLRAIWTHMRRLVKA